MKSSNPDKKKFACAYCGDKFPSKAVRAAHEKFAHVDIEGIFYACKKKTNSKEKGLQAFVCIIALMLPPCV